MSPCCDRCGGYIETSNRTFPGYCHPICRDRDQAERAERRDRERHRLTHPNDTDHWSTP